MGRVSYAEAGDYGKEMDDTQLGGGYCAFAGAGTGVMVGVGASG